ncbi:MAG: sugar transferase [Clostridia bacterium]|nr:sugar transferase [Clostridia bacterium]
MYQRYMKRVLDIIVSFCGLIVLSPMFLALAIWIRLDSPGPVFFKQKRVGKNKTYFNILKFRTMRTDAPHDMPTHLLRDPEAFITRSGRFLRRTSLDELPQIINILVGEMSVIGPRPALWNQDDLIAERDRYGANDVTPGLTGWAQVNGRDELEIPEKARLDGEYVSHLTFKMDATCFLMTFGNVLKQKGVVEGGTGVMAQHLQARKNELREQEKDTEETYGGKNSA